MPGAPGIAPVVAGSDMVCAACTINGHEMISTCQACLGQEQDVASLSLTCACCCRLAADSVLSSVIILAERFMKEKQSPSTRWKSRR